MAKKKTAGPPAQPAGVPHRTAHQKFETREVPRDALKNAEYNPRTINDKARRKLRKVLQKIGLVQPIVWNELSGNIVGGHQRIEILDSLEGSKEYTLTVAVVRMDEKGEREANLALNNQEAAGEFDLAKLHKIFKENTLDVEATGYELADLYKLFGESPMAKEAEHLDKMAETLEKLQKASADIKEAMIDRNDCDFYLVAVFPSHGDRKKFTDRLGEDDNRYINGSSLEKLLPPAPAPQTPQAVPETPPLTPETPPPPAPPAP